MTAPPGQLLALKCFIALKEALSWYVVDKNTPILTETTFKFWYNTFQDKSKCEACTHIIV